MNWSVAAMAYFKEILLNCVEELGKRQPVRIACFWTEI